MSQRLLLLTAPISCTLRGLFKGTSKCFPVAGCVHAPPTEPAVGRAQHVVGVVCALCGRACLWLSGENVLVNSEER